MSHFTPENWNHVQYINQDQRALISIGSDLDGNFQYFVTVIDENDQLIFQSEHSTLETACENMNLKFQDFWDFKDLAVNDTGGGCGSCQAH